MFRGTEGSTEHSSRVVVVDVWNEDRAVASGRKEGGQSGTGGVLEVAERFMVRWHCSEATLRSKRHVSAMMDGVQGNGEVGGTVSRRETAVDESRKEGRQQCSKVRSRLVGPNNQHISMISMLLVPQTAAAASNEFDFAVFIILFFL